MHPIIIRKTVQVPVESRIVVTVAKDPDPIKPAKPWFVMVSNRPHDWANYQGFKTRREAEDQAVETAKTL